MAYISFDFAQGEVSSRILQALSQAKISVITELQKNGCFRNNNYDYTSLLYRHIDDYARASGYTLRYFLFGSENFPVPYYTNVDTYVIDILNQLSQEQLVSLKNIIQTAFPSKLYNMSRDLKPMQRYIAVLDNQRKPLFPKEIPDSEKYKYRKDVMIEIFRYTKHSRYSNRFAFNSDYWADLAMLKGVSVRWILGVKETTLYCNPADADDIFDAFTLMSSLQKYGFLKLLRTIAPTIDPEFERICEEGRI